MSTNKTQHYQLNQWEAEDKVLRMEFNEDNQKIDTALFGKASREAMDQLTQKAAVLAADMAGKGNCQVVAGSYVGTGGAGASAPNRLTFQRRPMLLYVYGSWRLLCGRGETSAAAQSTVNNDRTNTVTWEERAVSGYNDDGKASPQLNDEGRTYHYLALLEME